MFSVPEDYRLKTGVAASDQSYGCNGAFVIPHPWVVDYFFVCIVSDGAAVEGGARWEHVSIELQAKYRKVDRCPTWPEMCCVKDIFWTKDECVVQFHPEESSYVNRHQFCLHLWKPIGQTMPVPPKVMV